MPINNSSESNGNVPKLSHVAEQQQQQTNKIGGLRFCDDVLQDALPFLRRNEHAHVRLVSRRLQWLSDTACARYPPRVVPRLEVRGVYAVPALTINGVRRAKAPRPQFFANSMRVHPPSGDSYLADFPAVRPPQDIIRLSDLEITDFVGPELLQFLRVSARLMHDCHIVFANFHNFMYHHSTDFISRFLALFPSGANRTIELRGVSALATPLFLDRPPTMFFDCTHLTVECFDNFHLDVLQYWVHPVDDEQQLLLQQPQKRRYLDIRFGGQYDVGHKLAYMGHLVQQLRQRFLSDTSCCPFTVKIELPARPYIRERSPFVEDNEQTGELLEFRRDGHQFYKMERKRRENAGQEEGDGEAETEEERTTATMVYIREVVQGEEQLLDLESEEWGEW